MSGIDEAEDMVNAKVSEDMCQPLSVEELDRIYVLAKCYPWQIDTREVIPDLVYEVRRLKDELSAEQGAFERLRGTHLKDELISHANAWRREVENAVAAERKRCTEIAANLAKTAADIEIERGATIAEKQTCADHCLHVECKTARGIAAAIRELVGK